ncbi:UDP-Glycosyltransferase/glycogen phosphorylase [Meredithblackwellia eburnea MCA 4105]
MAESHSIYSILANWPIHYKLVAFSAALLVSISALSSAILALLAFNLSSHLKSTNSSKRTAILKRLAISDSDRSTLIAGFFHPYCNAGGGGERVLWVAIASLQSHDRNVVSVVYTGDDVAKDAMIAKVKNRFGIALDPATIEFITLKKRYLVEDNAWPRFTLLGQSLGSIGLAFEALTVGLIPDIWIDTMGYAFPYPFVRYFCKIPVGSYTHYPTISTDMLRRVRNREAGHTNTNAVAKSALLSSFKLYYYIIFAKVYSFCLRRADVLMVNSTWTRQHIDTLLGYTAEVDPCPLQMPSSSPSSERLKKRAAKPSSTSDKSQVVPTPCPTHKRPRTVYPPCDTASLAALPLEGRENMILSLAQFRPEKEHHVQLRAFKLFLAQNPQYKTGKRKYKLIMSGSVRNEGDEKRVVLLRDLAKELDIEDNVEFVINVPFPTLVGLLGRASIGLHTMIDEHFGITVVEFLAAGLLTLAHASAGPLYDIIVPSPSGLPTGFHATDPKSFAEKLGEIVAMDERDKLEMRERARRNVRDRFGEKAFEEGWMEGWRKLVSSVKR